MALFVQICLWFPLWTYPLSSSVISSQKGSHTAVHTTSSPVQLPPYSTKAWSCLFGSNVFPLDWKDQPINTHMRELVPYWEAGSSCHPAPQKNCSFSRPSLTIKRLLAAVLPFLFCFLGDFFWSDVNKGCCWTLQRFELCWG